MTIWESFLSTQNLDPGPFSVSSPETRADGLLQLIAMSGHRFLAITGQDAVKFLQGQVTCDVEAVARGEWRLGAHCNPKGRMISSFVAAAPDSNSLLLRVCDDIAEVALAALRKYIVFAKAGINVTDHVALSLLGPLDAGPLPIALPPVGQSESDGKVTVVRRSTHWAEIWMPPQQLPDVWAALAAISSPHTSDWLELHQIREGIAEVTSTTSESFLPQMFNYQLIGGISFRKGCYTGQEIVARMQYKGQLKKHLYRLSVTSEVPVAIGSELKHQDRPLGTVVASVHDGQYAEMLAVCSAEFAGQSGCLAAKTESEIEWLSLPYAIP